MLLVELEATANSSELIPGPGLGTRVQWEPSQCRIRVSLLVMALALGPLGPVLPTAHVSLAEVPATPARSLETPDPPGSGVLTRVQVLPFQCRASVWSTPPITENPTAQVSVLDVPRTAKSSSSVPRLGLVTWAHVWPFQCRVSVLSVLAAMLEPTAQASVDEGAATASSRAPVPGLGLATGVQVPPPQCRISVFSVEPVLA